MPSVKPDRNEINQLRAKRGSRPPVKNLFSPVLLACVNAFDRGYIDQDRAKLLLAAIKNEPIASKIFPNTLLIRVLETVTAKGKWSTNIENTLFKLISSLYFGNDGRSIEPVGMVVGVGDNHTPFVREMSSEEDPEHINPPGDIFEVLIKITKAKTGLLAGSYEMIFDDAQDKLIVQDRFVGFTGEFRNFTRKECFDVVRKLGGVPSDPAYYLDYLFVGESFSSNQILSNQIVSAISTRRKYGNPLILKESALHTLIKLTSKHFKKPDETGL